MVYEVHNLSRTRGLEKVFHLSYLPWEANIIKFLVEGKLYPCFSPEVRRASNPVVSTFHLMVTYQKRRKKERKFHFSVSCVLIRSRHFCYAWMHIKTNALRAFVNNFYGYMCCSSRWSLFHDFCSSLFS